MWWLLSSLALAQDPRTPLGDFDKNVRAGLSPEPGQLVVRVVAGPAEEDVDAMAARSGCALHHRWGRSDWYTITCDPAEPVRRLIQRWTQMPGVSWVQASFAAELALAPDDLPAQQWHHRNTGQTIGGQSGTVGVDIGSVSAWDLTTGDDTAIVAVIDTGVFVDHADLAGRIWANPGEICGNSRDDDANGYVDDCEGWDPADDDNDPDPRKLPSTQPDGSACVPFHGTFIAGLVAAAGNNTRGGTGILWDGRVMPIKMATDRDCRLFDTSLAEGIRYAVDNGADVLNASWAYAGTSMALDEALARVGAKGSILVIAAGNDGKDVDGLTTYPIDNHVVNDIVVAASTNRDALAGFSNYGARDVDIAAPGQNLWSTGLNSTDHHVEASGTSFAAPLVAGGAALVWSAYPMLRAREVRVALLEGAVVVPDLVPRSGRKSVDRGRRLSLPGALAQADEIASLPQLSVASLELVEAAGDNDGILERGESARIEASFQNDGHVASGPVQVRWSVIHPHALVTPETQYFASIEAYGVLRPSDPPTVSVNLACVDDDPLVIRATISDGTAVTGIKTLEVLVPCNIDEDGDGSLYPEDCDDTDPTIAPGSPETCNFLDDNCDGAVDEGLPGIRDYFLDDDRDGYGGPTRTSACKAPERHVDNQADCDDTNSGIYPAAAERCDGVDQDCDNQVDESAFDATPLFVDLDGDGWGTGPAEPACEVTPGTAARDGDCDDTNADAFPGAPGWTDDCRRTLLGCACNSPGGTPAFGPFLLLLVATWLSRRHFSGKDTGQSSL
jgi:subtilisin family serine protease